MRGVHPEVPGRSWEVCTPWYPDGHARYTLCTRTVMRGSPWGICPGGYGTPWYMPRWIWYTLVIYHPGYVGR